MSNPLPPGQRERLDFPRFGLKPYAFRFPKDVTHRSLMISGDCMESISIDAPIDRLARTELRSDFHCVTTWTKRDLAWGGVLFSEFYRRRIALRLVGGKQVNLVVLRGQDGYRTSLPLNDLLAEDVLLADTLGGRPLTLEHGAPLRLIAPAHYGYKAVKHISHIEFWSGAAKNYRPAAFAFMDHPRARVAHEERGRWIPGWILRFLYRPMIASTAAQFQRALAQHLKATRAQMSRRST